MEQAWERGQRRRGPGGGVTEKQERFVRLIERGMSNAEACRMVGINCGTGTRWRFGRTILNTAGEPVREPPQRAAPKMEAAGPLIDAMLRQDWTRRASSGTPARRVLARLIDEHDIPDVSYSTVRDYVARRRPEINIEAGDVRALVSQPAGVGISAARNPTVPGSSSQDRKQSCRLSRNASHVGVSSRCLRIFPVPGSTVHDVV